MLKRMQIFGVATAATLLIAATANAAPVIDFFSTGGIGGLITSSGGNVVGTNIPVGGVTIEGAPSGDGTYAVYGSASSTSGGVTTFGLGDLDLNTNPGSNFISVNGCIPELGLGTFSEGACSQTYTLLQGTISGYIDFGSGIFITAGTDTKNADLLARLGLPADTLFFIDGSFSSALGATTGNGSPALSTDIRNTAAPIPEPATMMLLGTGLLAAFRARKRKA